MAQKLKEQKKEEERKRLVLLDTHAILHRAYHALPDFSTAKGEPTGALYGLSSMLLRILKDLKPDYIAACYDLPGGTFRHEAYDGYKAQRKKTDDDLVVQIERSRDIFTAFNIPIFQKEGFEADDLLGTLAEIAKKKGLEVIIASGDMDTLQLVDGEQVKVYTLKKGINDTILYDEERVKERFGFLPKFLPDYKGLRGDPSDNIIGIKGVGEKTASDLIQTFGSLENIYTVLKKDPKRFEVPPFKKRILELLREGEEEAEFSKMLALIRRDVPVEFSLPKERWGEGVEEKKLEALFTELEFRSLISRAREVFSKAGSQGILLGMENSSEEGKGTMKTEEKKWNEREEKELLVALSVLNSNLTKPTLDDAFRFAKTKNFEEARKVIYGEIEKRNLKRVFEEIEKPIIPILERMREKGIYIDVKFLKSLSVEYHKRLSKIETEIYSLAGEEFNINSPKQLSAIIFDKLKISLKNHKKTGGGEKSTRESELLKMNTLHPIIPQILLYRELQKLLSTYIDNLPHMVRQDGRVHTEFLQMGATTGRMASINPNLQNIPIKSEDGRRIRSAFVAPKEFSLVALDYAQIELKLAAILSDDEKLLDIFRREGDIHAAVAGEVFGVPLEMVDQEMRRRAKVINFGILYGMGVNALRENLGTTREEAQKFYNEYFASFGTLASYLNRVKADASRKGYTETLFGRRRYFEGIQSKIPYIRASAERMAINAPIQGTSADIIKIAMGRIQNLIEEEELSENISLLLQVHDELLFEIKEGKEKEILPKIKTIMENVLTPQESKGVRLSVSVSLGKNWGSLSSWDLNYSNKSSVKKEEKKK